MKIVMPLVSVILTLLAAELLVRMIVPQSTDFYDYSRIARPSALAGQDAELIPNAHNPGFIGASVQINSLALRGHEIKLSKPSSTYRVLAIGDSIAFGYGVELDEIYIKVLERQLNSQPSNRRYEVINGGLIAADLGYYYHFLRRSAGGLHPDMILIGLALNDIRPYKEYVLESVYPENSKPAPNRIRSINAFLRANSHLYELLYSGIKSILYKTGSLDLNKNSGFNFSVLDDSGESTEYAWKRTFSVLKSIFSLARKRGYAVVLVVFPLEVQINDSVLAEYRDNLGLRIGKSAMTGEPQRRLRVFAASENIPFVDLLPAFRAAKSTGLFLRNKSISHDPVHPSPKGHRIAGEVLARELRALLPTASSVNQTKDINPTFPK